ncbi:MAG: DUF5810 domain-containing protein [Haloferacaceae archaeon]
MGYACPVCETPQRDAEHLANHLAFAAMLHGGDHRAWLDDNAPGWADDDPASLGDRVAPLAPEATYDAVFEGSVTAEDGSGPGRPGPVDVPSGAGRAGGDAMDETTRAVLAEAREMTRRMRAERDGERAEARADGPEPRRGADADGTGGAGGSDGSAASGSGGETAGTGGPDGSDGHGAADPGGDGRGADPDGDEKA